MAPNELYTLEEAEELKHSYACWINKAAHAGDGHIDILIAIAVTRKRMPKVILQSKRKYNVFFQFANSKKLTAYEFLANNGLIPAASSVLYIHTPHTPHTPLT